MNLETIIFFILVFIGVAILITDYSTSSSRYLSCVFFTGAISVFSDNMGKLCGYLIAHPECNISKNTVHSIQNVTTIFTQFAENFLVYFVAMYCISYSMIFKPRFQKYIGIGLFIMVSIFFFRFPLISTNDKYAANIYFSYYKFCSLWIVPLVLFSTFLLILSYKKETNPRTKKHRLINMICIIPIIYSSVLNVFIFRAFGIIEPTSINFYFGLFVFIIFAFFLIRTGAMGIRVRFERQSVVSSLDAIAQGTAVFNHTLKNEVNKLDLSTRNIQYQLSVPNMDTEDVKNNISVVANSTEHLRILMERIKLFSNQINLTKQDVLIKELIDKCLQNMELLIVTKHIQIVGKYDFELVVKCDCWHMSEVINNIIKNALEAVEDAGIVQIIISGNKSMIHLSIMDNGKGIKKEYLSRVFEPFFTTKRPDSNNFGLGLSYCYRVIQKHNFDLNVYSTENIGTTFTISIPSKNITYFDKRITVEEHKNGYNKSNNR